MITILGGGIGGLTLAAILTRHDVPCIVYDADLSVNSRHQGGMLNINEGPAHDALLAAGIYDAFRAKVLEDGDATKLMNGAGDVLFEDAGDGTRPEIDRGSLRAALADALPDGIVRWSSKVTSVERTDGGFHLTFADGRVETAELLVGADGTWSKVRHLLTTAVPAYTGISFVEYRYLESSRRWPVARRLIGDGLMFALADERGIIGHREPADELCVYAALRVPEGHFAAEPSRDEIRAAFEGWHPDFLTVLDASDGGIVARSLYALPIGLTWERAPGVTLLGDAAHVMSPFAGEGVNLAMIDGAELARALVDHPGDPEAAMREYEARLFPRSRELAEASASGLENAFAPDGAQRYLDFFMSAGRERDEP